MSCPEEVLNRDKGYGGSVETVLIQHPFILYVIFVCGNRYGNFKSLVTTKSLNQLNGDGTIILIIETDYTMQLVVIVLPSQLRRKFNIVC